MGDGSELGRIFRVNNSFKPLLPQGGGGVGVAAITLDVAKLGCTAFAVRYIQMSFY